MNKLLQEYNDKIKDMKMYNIQHKLNKIDNTFNKKKEYIVDDTINNINRMDKKDMDKLLNKCLSYNQTRTLLLKYEMKNRKSIKNFDTLDNVIKYISNLLHRYHHRAGGFLLEDDTWTVHKSLSKKYNINSNQVYFENSVPKEYVHDNDTIEYIRDIYNMLNNINENLKVKYELKNSRHDNIIWVIFKCTYKQLNDTKKISL